MKLGVPPEKKTSAQKTKPKFQAANSNKNKRTEPKTPNARKENRTMPGQSYVWRVVVKNILPAPKLNKTFTNKVEALNYLNKMISQGYKNSKLDKWEGK